MENLQQSPRAPAKGRKPRARKFYLISYSLRHGLADFEVENLNVLLTGITHAAMDLDAERRHLAGDLDREHLGDPHEQRDALMRARVLCPPQGRRGFPAYPENPRVVIGKRKRGPLPSDIELFHNYWLISDRLKCLFEALDPQACAFQACDVRLRDGSPGPAHWLCDVVRVLDDAFGEETMQDIRRYQERTGRDPLSVINLGTTKFLVFNELAIGKSHLFRTSYSWPRIFCDQDLKDACKAAGLKGVAFRDCTAKRKKTAPPTMG